MKHLCIGLFCLVYMVIISACEYKLTDIYERETGEVNIPDISVENFFVYNDTIFITPYKSLDFTLTAGNSKIRFVNIFINNSLIKTIKGNQVELTASNLNLASGIYTLRIDVVTETGTGSIADILGTEGIEFKSGEFVLALVKDIGRASYVNSEINENGLTLSWEPYKYADFSYYIIQINETESISTSLSPDIEYNDYVGEEINAQIQVVSKLGQTYEWAEIEVSKNIPKLYYGITSQKKIGLLWDKPIYNSNVESYVIYKYSIDAQGYYQVATIDAEAQFEYIEPVFLFGSSVEYKLHAIPKKNKDIRNTYNYISFLNTRSGLPCPTFSDIHIIGIDSCMLKHNQQTLLYSFTEGGITDSLNQTCHSIELASSASGASFSIQDYCNQKILIGKTKKLADYNTYSSVDLVIDELNLPIYISDINIGVIEQLENILLYDFAKNQTILTIPNTYYVNDIAISTDAHFLFLQSDKGRMYKIENNNVTLQWTDEDNTSIFFDPFKRSQIIAIKNQNISICNADDYSVQTSYNIIGKVSNIDFYSRRLLTSHPGQLQIWSLDEGVLLQEVNCANSPSGSFSLVNNSILSTSGFYINTLYLNE